MRDELAVAKLESDIEVRGEVKVAATDTITSWLRILSRHSVLLLPRVSMPRSLGMTFCTSWSPSAVSVVVSGSYGRGALTASDPEDAAERHLCYQYAIIRMGLIAACGGLKISLMLA